MVAVRLRARHPPSCSVPSSKEKKSATAKFRHAQPSERIHGTRITRLGLIFERRLKRSVGVAEGLSFPAPAHRRAIGGTCSSPRFNPVTPAGSAKRRFCQRRSRILQLMNDVGLTMISGSVARLVPFEAPIETCNPPRVR